MIKLVDVVILLHKTTKVNLFSSYFRANPEDCELYSSLLTSIKNRIRILLYLLSYNDYIQGEQNMESKNLHEIIESNINSLMETEQNHAPSMRYLSTCIGASSSYIQKILSGPSYPSLDKLEAIGEHYEVDTWCLLYDYGDKEKQILPIVQQLSRCPKDLLPVISQYIEFLMGQNKK